MGELHVECITDIESLHDLADEWNSVLEDSRFVTIFRSLAWATAWLRCNDVDLAVLLIRDGSELVGIAPFYRTEMRLLNIVDYRCLRLVGDSESGAEYLMPFFRRGAEEAGFSVLTSYLLAEADRWDFIWMPNQASWAPDYDAFTHAISGSVLAMVERDVEFASIELPVDGEAFWASQSASSVSTVRRAKKRLMNDDLVISCCEEQDDLVSYTRALFRLHEARWRELGDSGAFNRRPQFKQFIEVLLPELLAQGSLRFYVLQVDGQPRAIQLGFVFAGAYSILQEGFDPGYSSGAGHVLRAHVIEACIKEGVTEYDFLGGFSEHKRRWGAACRIGKDVMIWNRKWRNLAFDLGPIWPSGRFMQEVRS